MKNAAEFEAFLSDEVDLNEHRIDTLTGRVATISQFHGKRRAAHAARVRTARPGTGGSPRTLYRRARSPIRKVTEAEGRPAILGTAPRKWAAVHIGDRRLPQERFDDVESPLSALPSLRSVCRIRRREWREACLVGSHRTSDRQGHHSCGPHLFDSRQSMPTRSRCGMINP